MERSSKGVREDANIERRTPGVMGILLSGSACFEVGRIDAPQYMDLNPEYVKQRLSSHPFVTVDGVHNIRSLGNYPAPSTAKVTRDGYIFRAAVLSSITSTGIEQLAKLGVKKVFDLRSDIELVKFGKPNPDFGPSIETERIPVFTDEDYSQEKLTLRSNLFKSVDPHDVAQVYVDILEGGIRPFQAIFSHIRDYPDQSFVFHCTSGKDRTGVLAALILKLAGVPETLIVDDYVLTRIGIEPTRQSTIAKLQYLPDFLNDMEGLLRSLDTRPQSMEKFLNILDVKYQGVEIYMQKYLGFTLEDVETIRRNLVDG